MIRASTELCNMTRPLKLALSSTSFKQIKIHLLKKSWEGNKATLITKGYRKEAKVAEDRVRKAGLHVELHTENDTENLDNQQIAQTDTQHKRIVSDDFLHPPILLIRTENQKNLPNLV